jgi:hypothetical protein
MITRILLAALAASAIVACGDGKPSTTTPTSAQGRGIDAKAKKAMLDFAKCMRRHGVDMPDPKFESGGGVQMTQKDSGDPATQRAAQSACRHFQDEAKPPPMSEAQQAEARKRGLANSRCMRQHGINMPDPQFDADGRMTMKIDTSSGIDPTDPKFQAAQKACMKDGPGGIMSARSGK